MNAIFRVIIALPAFAALAALSTGEARAQGWDWEIAPYLWTVGMDGFSSLGPLGVDVDVNFSDIVDLAEGGAALHFEGGGDDHGLFGDVVWLSLELDDEVARGVGPAEVQFDTTVVEIGYLYRGGENGLELGARYWDFELDINPALISAIERGQDWVDGFIGFRHTADIGDDWRWTLRLNAGAGGSDFTYGFDVSFAREFDSGNRFVAGIKALDIDYEEASVRGIPFRLDLLAFGATVGYVFD